jgi:multidrug resistance efflux pump
MSESFIDQSIEEISQKNNLNAFAEIYQINKASTVIKWMIFLLVFAILILFLPWTQHIRAKGKVTALRQEQRPQQVPSVLPGRIIKWHVKEGDFVEVGDTLIEIAEIKDDYFDPQLLQRVNEQLNAKKQSMESYQQKAKAATQQIDALQNARTLKLAELNNKFLQQEMKIKSDSADLIAVANDLAIKKEQWRRQKIMYDSGLVSLAQLEQRNQSLQDARAKYTSAEIKYSNAKQELNRILLETNGERQQYAEKVAKTDGERFQSYSQVQTSEGEIAKLSNQFSNYNIRRGLLILRAPQRGQIIQAKKAGIGEMVKEGEQIVEIVPDHIQYAVELYVSPNDLPLINIGQQIQFFFDGYPAIVFSGWPKASTGSFSGEVSAVEQSISDNGKFRVLVKEKKSRKPWPKQLVMGTGAQGFALLKDVSVWYELWRNVNGFPPDFYSPNEEYQKPEKKIKTAKKY